MSGSSPGMRVAHLTSVHRRYDTRIFFKECRSLAAQGFSVSLVVADGSGDEARDGVTIVSVGAPKGRARRMLQTTRQVARRALEMDAELYHIHDPELLPVALWLKRRGRHVIFDAHEDLPEQVRGKSYIPRRLRPLVAGTAGLLVKNACRRLDGVVAATPYIRDQFVAMGVRCIDADNFPMLGELDLTDRPSAKRQQVCYIGSIAAVRGVCDAVRAMSLVQPGTRLALAGQLAGSDVETAVQREAGWERVDALGFLDRRQIREVLGHSIAGLVTLHPNGNFLNALPVKMFEYMAAGIPVIASDFPLWRRIVEEAECGLLVDPLHPAAIAAAIDRLVGDPEMARRMGENGRRAVLERYNWGVEEQKLFAFYDAILSREAA